MRDAKRRPAIGDRVLIGVGASVLGPISVGNDCEVRAHCLVLESVPAQQSSSRERPGNVIEPTLHIRIARPVLDLAVSRQFYVDGLGLRALADIVGKPELGERDLLMVGPAGGHWHLELTASAQDVVIPTPTPEDLLVIYLGRPLAAEMVAQAVEHGGSVTPAHNPYWDRGGVTICDPDGYRIVLSDQSWDSAESRLA
jgi:catechol 2,3-dioxygenase-like lactoylglutathione lyase family enzyme